MSDDNVVDISDAKAKRPRRPPRQPTGDWTDTLTRNDKGGLHATPANAIAVLANAEEWADVFTWNEFSQCVQTTRIPPWDDDAKPAEAVAGDVADADVTRVQTWLNRHWGLRVGADVTWAAIRVVADRKIINPPRDYLLGARGFDPSNPLVDTWMVRYLGAPDTPYVRRVGRWFLISSVARILNPGCKCDHMPVLEGPQGLGKSTALRALFSDEFFSDTTIDLHTKDRFVSLRNVWGYEWAELDGLGRADVTRVKAFISSQVDDYRPPFGRGNVKVPRRVVFVGTVNEATYLTDPSGNRRFWPLRCGHIDIAAILRDRDALWAEAVALFQSGERWWPESAETDLLAEEQAERVAQDAWEPMIASYLSEKVTVATNLRQPDPFLTVGDVLAGALSIEKAKWDQPSQNRCARILRNLKWKRTQRRIDAESRVWGYIREKASPVAPVTSNSTGDGIPE